MDRKKILIIDNDVKSTEESRKVLENVGFAVTVVTQGKEGIEVVHNLHPDLVIIEAMLPDVNGFSVCRELKENPDYRSIPILIVTALGTSEETYLSNMATEHKADGFLVKPVSGSDLLQKIGDMLSSTTPSTKEIKSRAKILLIDDDPDFLDATKQLLIANRFQVLTAENGEEGIGKAKYEKPDLIVLDVIMPGKDGYSVCYELRQIAETRPIPIIMLTAVGQQLSKPEYAMDMAIDHLADDYIDKPVDTQTLIRKIEKHLRR
ncbi:MAG: response regulator [candidate division WOR-3 bacterium]|nr:MAG: response regulator [candidate division WOR-3 bacterium]